MAIHEAPGIATPCLIVLLAISSILRAQEHGPWWMWPTTDGNWGGYRQTFVN